MSVFLVWTLSLIFLVRSTLTVAPSLSPTALQSNLENLANDALGIKDIQAIFNRATSAKPKSEDGNGTIMKLADDLSREFKKLEEALNKLRLKAEEAFKAQTGTTTTLERCCHIADGDVKFDSRFNTSVSETKSCDRVPWPLTPPPFVNIYPALQQTFKDNLKAIPQLKWQYYASEEGYSTFYPTLQRPSSECGTYDARYRPWYAAAAVPEPKNVVVVLDASGSMGDSVGTTDRLSLAKEGVYAVLDTLYPTDTVTVIAFDDGVSLPQLKDCFRYQLAEGTPINIKLLKEFVKDINPGGGTNFVGPLKKAFDLLKNTTDLQSASGISIQRDNIILFLSDGDPEERDTEIYAAIQSGNSKLQHPAVLLSFGAGKDLKQKAKTILDNMARKTLGQYQNISSFKGIREAFGHYYAFFSKPSSTPIMYSMPYYDLLGLGLVITIASPVRYNRRLKGVVAVDITLNDVLSNVTYFHSGDHQYAFIIDKLGYAVTHPMLPVTLQTHSDLIFHNIRLLETDQEFETVYKSMMSRQSGHMTYNATRYIRRGNSKFEGTESVIVTSTYFWRPITGTDYVVCIVLQTNEINHLPILSNQTYQPPATIYHRLDLVVPSVRKCSQFGFLALPDHTTVKFAPEAFLDPSHYLNVPEMKETVQAYLHYLDDSTGVANNIYFKSSVRNNVRLTAKCERLWTSSKALPYHSSLVWRYIAATDGVFRVLPGSRLALGWNAFQRGWYLRALSNPGRLTLSTPYVDGFGAGYVITLSQTVSLTTASTKTVAAVAALDFTMGYLWKLLLTNYKQCSASLNQNQCFIMDKQGYLIVHKDFINTTANPSWVHLASKEPVAARTLIQEGIMKLNACANYETRRLHYSYEITYSGTQFTSPNGCFKMYRIPNTNIYLGIVSSSLNCNTKTTPCWFCLGVNDLSECSSVPMGKGCTCPCWMDLEYNTCANNYSSSSRSHDVCPPEVFSLPVPIRTPDTTKNLRPCFDVKCSTITDSYLTCDATVGCSYCRLNASKAELKMSYCATDLTCYGGIQGKCNPLRDCQGTGDGSAKEADKTSSLGAGAFIGIGVAVAVVVGVVISIVYAKTRCRSKMIAHDQQPKRETHTTLVEPPLRRQLDQDASAPRLEMPVKLSGSNRSYPSSYGMDSLY